MPLAKTDPVLLPAAAAWCGAACGALLLATGPASAQVSTGEHTSRVSDSGLPPRQNQSMSLPGQSGEPVTFR
jgi:hypothetical protein